MSGCGIDRFENTKNGETAINGCGQTSSFFCILQWIRVRGRRYEIETLFGQRRKVSESHSENSGIFSFISLLFRFYIEQRCWTMVAPLSSTRSHFSMVETRGFLYALGGKQGNQCRNLFDCYDPIENAWHSMQPMGMARSFAYAVLYKEHIYAIGGSTAVGADMAIVERYNTDRDNWESVIDIIMKLIDFH